MVLVTEKIARWAGTPQVTNKNEGKWSQRCSEPRALDTACREAAAVECHFIFLLFFATQNWFLY